MCSTGIRDPSTGLPKAVGRVLDGGMSQGVVPQPTTHPRFAETDGLMLAPAYVTLLAAAACLADADPWLAVGIFAALLGAWSWHLSRGAAVVLAVIATLLHSGFVVHDTGELGFDGGTAVTALVFLGVALACARRPTRLAGRPAAPPKTVDEGHVVSDRRDTRGGSGRADVQDIVTSDPAPASEAGHSDLAHGLGAGFDRLLRPERHPMMRLLVDAPLTVADILAVPPTAPPDPESAQDGQDGAQAA